MTLRGGGDGLYIKGRAEGRGDLYQRPTSTHYTRMYNLFANKLVQHHSEGEVEAEAHGACKGMGSGAFPTHWIRQN